MPEIRCGAMRWVPSSYVRQNWSRVMDEAMREPVAVTSHGRTRVIIVDAALSEQLVGLVADTGPRLPDPPKYPWFDANLTINQRVEKLRERKREIFAKPLDDWSDEEHRIIAQSEYHLD